MPSCCRADTQSGTGRFFTKNADRSLRRFRKSGLRKEQRMLAEGIAAAAPAGSSILEIGCGIGSLHQTLLERVGGRALGIDLSEGMIRSARSLAAERGLADRARYRDGDFVALRHEIPPSDIVILDKVVCCYADLELLLGASLERAARVYALSYPRPRWFIRWGIAGVRTLGAILRWDFVPQWHDWEAMLRRIREAGFAEHTAGATFFWSVLIFQRR